ncbi:MAG: polysaccharide biosynthesis/export family protein [Bacteroidales bacterium]|nr:polysaccharide biosynthesis/export family protein [Bacteroidales bacterium]
MKPAVFFVSIVTFFMLSCNNRAYIYFYESPSGYSDTILYKPVKTTYLVKPDDILYVEFHSASTDAEQQFSSKAVTGGGNIELSPSVIYINHYVVSGNGTIKMPVLGEISVAGLSAENIEKLIENEGRKYINDITAKVKLVSYKITFLGEFGDPGEKYFYSDNVSLFDALAAAGEITYYGNRKNLRVMRQTTEGIKSFRINLNDPELINSPYFYLKPNDIVYAEPKARKTFRLLAADYSLLIVTITSTLTIITLIITNQRPAQ